MSKDVIDFLLPVMLVSWFGWMIYSVMRGRSSRKIADENTQAIRENTELLRELVTINRKLLEQKELTGA